VRRAQKSKLKGTELEDKLKRKNWYR